MVTQEIEKEGKKGREERIYLKKEGLINKLTMGVQKPAGIVKIGMYK